MSEHGFRDKNKRMTHEQIMRIGTNKRGESVFKNREDSALAAHRDRKKPARKKAPGSSAARRKKG